MGSVAYFKGGQTESMKPEANEIHPRFQDRRNSRLGWPPALTRHGGGSIYVGYGVISPLSASPGSFVNHQEGHKRNKGGKGEGEFPSPFREKGMDLHGLCSESKHTVVSESTVGLE